MPADTATREQSALAWRKQIPATADHVAVEADDLRSRRHGELELGAISAMTQRALAMPSTWGPSVRPALECMKISHGVIADYDDVAASATIPAIGPTLRHVSFAAETDAAIAAGARLDIDLRTVVEHQLDRRSSDELRCSCVPAPARADLRGLSADLRGFSAALRGFSAGLTGFSAAPATGS